MGEAKSDEERSAAMAHLRAIRAEHGLNRRTRSAPAAPVSESTEDEGTLSEGSPPDRELEDPMAIKYALELAAHRETTDRLLAEKDRTIEVQGDLIAELKAQVAALGAAGVGSGPS